MSVPFDLRQAVGRAFAPNGPVASLFGGHRAPQATFAENVAGFLADTRMRRDATPTGFLPSKFMQEAAPGVGKTAVLGVEAGLYAVMTGGRSIIATYTRDLRKQYVREAERISQVVAAVGGRPLEVCEWIASSSMPSMSRIEAFQRRWLSKPTSMRDDSDKHALRFAEFFLDADEGVALTDWLSLPESDGRFPHDMPETSFSLIPADERGPTADWLREQRQRARRADVVVTTHATVLRDNLTFGALLGTAKPRNEASVPADFRAVRAVFCDEADALISMARTITGTSVKVSDVHAALHNLITLDEPDLLNRATQAANAEQYSLADAKIGLLNADHLNHRIRPTAERLFDALRDAASHLVRADESDPLAADDVCRVLGTLVPIVLFSRRPGTTEPVPNGMDLTRCRFRVSRPLDSDRSLDVTGMTTEGLIRQMWTQGGSRTVDAYVFTSGTLASAFDNKSRAIDGLPYGMFRAGVGALRLKPHDVVLPEVSVRGHGAVEGVIWMQRDPALLPSLAKDKAEKRGSWQNPKHIEAVAKAVLCAASDPRVPPNSNGSRRVATLLASQEALDATRAALIKAGCHPDRIIAQRAGQRYRPLIDAYAARKDTIWLGLNWMGIDLRNDAEGTLVRSVVLSKVPLSPRFTGLGGMQRLMAFDEAFRRMRQGVGRGVRDANDRVWLWMLDPRIPLPIFAVRAFARQGMDVAAHTADGMNDYAPFNDAIRRGLLVSENDIFGSMAPKMGIFDPDQGLSLAQSDALDMGA